MHVAAKMDIEMQNYCAEMKIRAQRKGGKLITNLERLPGKRSDLTSSRACRSSTKAEELKKAGMKTGVANRWEKIASVPVEKFEQHISDTKKKTAFCTTFLMWRSHKGSVMQGRFVKNSLVLSTNFKKACIMRPGVKTPVAGRNHR